MSDEETSPEDILSTSLQTLYSYVPFAHSAAGKSFAYSFPVGRATVVDQAPSDRPRSLTVKTPDTHPSNWSLQVSSIWTSSLFLADHIQELELLDLPAENEEKERPGRLEVLELGAGAGLPGITLAKLLYERRSSQLSVDDWRVTLSDYPDDSLIRTLQDNAAKNIVQPAWRVIPYAWGSDATVLLSGTSSDHSAAGYDLVLAADTLWNPDFHGPFCQTLLCVLRRTPSARIHLVAGLHTGSYTIEAFLHMVKSSGLEIESVRERNVEDKTSRNWLADRQEWEDDMHRRRWVVWIVLKWEKN